jgi:pyroglutamyl-peptidase
MRILLIGFEPFGGDAINSSQETLKAVTCDEFGDVEVVAKILPVSFKRVGDVLVSLIDDLRPDVVMMLGQAGTSEKIRIERFALNLMDSVKGDNDGYIPDEETIFPDSHLALQSTLPLKAIKKSLTECGIPAVVSNSAGLYVCNATYYTVLHHIAVRGLSTQAVFIHLPKISEEWTIRKMKAAVGLIINAIYLS